jgi:hypothetical protein
MYDFIDKEVTSFQNFFGLLSRLYRGRGYTGNMLTAGYGLIGPAVGSLLIYSVELDWYPVTGVAGHRIQVALTKDRKRLPRRRRQQIPSKHWCLYTGIHCVVS